MPIDPQIAAVLSAMAASGAPSLTSGTPTQARASFDAVTRLLQSAVALPKVGEVSDPAVNGLQLRVYRPVDAAGPCPTVLFLHGGGWVIGSIATHDDQARRICRDAAAVVVSADYRLAPEARFPAAVNDAWRAFEWVSDHVDELGGDAARVGVAGDSAGGNLAAVVALRARDAGRPLAAQLLLYPGVDVPGDYASRTQNGEGYFLTLEDVTWFLTQYVGADRLGDPAVLANPELSPLRAATLTGLAPAVVATAGFDPLRDEGNAYASALADAGVPVVHRQFDDLIHGFFGMGGISAAADRAADQVVAEFRGLLGVTA